MIYHKNHKTFPRLIVILCLLSVSLLAHKLQAFVMESGSYRIQRDTLNTGGLRSQSSNYIQESTVGETATGLLESTNYRLKAGYQQLDTFSISISASADITLLPSIAGITGGTGNGGTQVVVTTENPAGFTLTIKTDSDTGMVGETQGDFIFHLVTATPEVPDFSFDSAPANSSAFAYTINASTTGDLVSTFLDNGSACNTGANQAEEKCWIAATTTARTVLSRSTATPGSGSTSTLRFRAIISANPAPEIDEDTYTATTTLTAVSL